MSVLRRTKHIFLPPSERACGDELFARRVYLHSGSGKQARLPARKDFKSFAGEPFLHIVRLAVSRSANVRNLRSLN